MSRKKNQERKALKDARRKLRGEPSVSFQVRGRAGDSMGDWSFDNWPSTKATDSAFDLLKFLFDTRKSKDSN